MSTLHSFLHGAVNLARTTALALGVLLLATALLGLAGCGTGAESRFAEDTPQPLIPVFAAAVESAPEGVEISFHGMLRARERSQVAPQVAGVLRRREVVLGTRVARGDVLGVLDHPTLDAAGQAAAADVAVLEPRLRKARLDLDRERALFARGLIAESRLESMAYEVESLEAGLQRARAAARGAAASAEELIVRAPHPGIVERLFAEPGDFLAAGQPLLSLANTEQLEAEFLLPPRLAAAIAVGAEVRLQGLGDPQPWPASVREKASGGDATGLVRVVVALPDPAPGRVAGEPVEARFSLDLVAGVRVPVKSLRAAGGVGPMTVLAVEAGHAVRHRIEPRHVLGDSLIAETALRPGALVITAGPSALAAGDPVRVLP